MPNALIARREEIESNFTAFEALLSKLLPTKRGKFAVMRDAQLVRVYDSLAEAVASAHSEFEDGLFSIQEVTNGPLDLGFYSHAYPQGQLRSE